MNQIESFITNEISPVLGQHGGGVELVSYDQESKTVFVKMIGACSGCPSSLLTAYGVVLSALQNKFPEEVSELEIV